VENSYSGSEIVQMGIEIEKNGKAFYDTLTAKTTHDDAKKIFEYLSYEEEKHIDAFQRILNTVQQYEQPENYTGEYFDYMNALAKEHVFTQANKGVEIAEKIKDDKEAIAIAKKFESDSIIFYEGMKKAVSEKEHKLLDMLIGQEREHLEKLTFIEKVVG